MAETPPYKRLGASPQSQVPKGDATNLRSTDPYISYILDIQDNKEHIWRRR
jgi:hypothetical protein